mmetsp:Transcript_183422/g.446538  ORF Transcript_183422/g.446538 Transcript_183422/m.446538 type:complete len:91 (+) Transcript_183422:188-460(+)
MATETLEELGEFPEEGEGERAGGMRSVTSEEATPLALARRVLPPLAIGELICCGFISGSALGGARLTPRVVRDLMGSSGLKNSRTRARTP